MAGLRASMYPPDLLVIDDFALLDPAYGGIDIDGRLQALDLGGLGIDVLDQFSLGGGLQRGRADLPLHPARTEQTTGQRNMTIRKPGPGNGKKYASRLDWIPQEAVGFTSN